MKKNKKKPAVKNINSVLNVKLFKSWSECSMEDLYFARELTLTEIEIHKQILEQIDIEYKIREAKAMPPENKSTTILSSERFYVAGVQYSDYKQLPLHLLKSGQQLNLRLQKNNPYDSKAIAIYLNTTRIGYVPRGPIQDKMHSLRGIADITAWLELCTPYPKHPAHMFYVRIDFKTTTKEEKF